MDDTYRRFYAFLYASRTDDEFASRFPLQPGLDRTAFVTPVREAIGAADLDLGPRYRLREDAIALLAVDFQDLVMLPLLAGGRVEYSELRDDITADIRLLASEAAAITPRGQSEVSGHRVIDALSQNWENLRIARHGLWEESA